MAEGRGEATNWLSKFYTVCTPKNHTRQWQRAGVRLSGLLSDFFAASSLKILRVIQ